MEAERRQEIEQNVKDAEHDGWYGYDETAVADVTDLLAEVAELERELDNATEVARNLAEEWAAETRKVVELERERDEAYEKAAEYHRQRADNMAALAVSEAQRTETAEARLLRAEQTLREIIESKPPPANPPINVIAYMRSLARAYFAGAEECVCGEIKTRHCPVHAGSEEPE